MKALRVYVAQQNAHFEVNYQDVCLGKYSGILSNTGIDKVIVAESGRLNIVEQSPTLEVVAWDIMDKINEGYKEVHLFANSPLYHELTASIGQKNPHIKFANGFRKHRIRLEQMVRVLPELINILSG